MIRKFLMMLISGIMVTSLVACSGNSNDKEAKTAQEPPKVEEKKFIGEGVWAEDYTKDQVTILNDEISARIEESATFYDLEYSKEEKVTEENGETINDNHIYIDNLNPEPNRMESMYYGFKMYGADMSSGSLNLKIGFKLDLEQIKTEEKFNIEETSIAKFSEAMTNNPERDYSDLNSKIEDIVINQNSNGTIETNVNGLVETITIKDDFLLYKLDSKNYDFKK
ncbi:MULTISPECIES: hypothetical protein [Clostridium]|jgi:hypothetical protein|uniref:Lipoprotein n=2 Tax=Bacillota TaxID=1239 RepID=A0A9X3XLQ0_9CLOT|nr:MULTISPECIES: hypothetical protein [Clostridium]EEH99155.1 hypothetical protein CSBG_02781 [Clostridium sp. 7_2_43FAA]MBP1867711.1 hypothetical protein [Clostridium tertium]MBS5307340.1 hypothetical protein [Clostridium sp.]MBU6136728.1 hypothetical protein [Clostridium tertium]MDB1934791.1 hypothetical protein [Clostridium tertium]